MKLRLALLLSLTLSLLPLRQASSLSDVLVVSPNGPYTTIEAALADAGEGDVIEVHGGLYLSLVVDKSVILEGVGWPVIYGGEQGTVVTLNAPGIVFRGFEVKGSGIEPDRDHAGITLTAPDIVVENNRLSDVLFGVFVAKADRAVVRNNNISSKTEYDSGRKGDGIRLWYSRNVVVENNHVHQARDLVMWYAENVVVRDNVIEDGRYGIHLMYCNGAQIEGNRILNNSVGIYTMYSHDVALHANEIRGQRGPSGYALGFKDADNVEVTGNVVADNRAGAFIDGTPFSPTGFAGFSGNIFAFNDVGVILLTATQGNTFTGNTFWENVEQVALQGGGDPGDNNWQGNVWSDYIGFDVKGEGGNRLPDGVGETPYRAERFFESLTDREPMLRVLLYSPAAQAIEFAGASFPIIKPQPKLVDESPRLQPAALPSWAVAPKRPAWPMTLLGLGLLACGAACGALAFLSHKAGANRKSASPNFLSEETTMTTPTSEPALQVDAVSKRYGRMMALDEVSFAIRPGEAVALWGINGAGKTTLIKAMLGLIEFSGEIYVEGDDVKRAGKATRRRIGYVPQEAIFYDMTVQTTMEFYARLKKVSPARNPALLEEMGLAEHAAKPVPALSGGLKQRLALAIALLADPPILLLDEPTANLDAKARRDYLARLSHLRKAKKTILFASHRFEEVETLADRVLVMESGRIAETLRPGEVRLRLAPEVEMTLWLAEGERERALACFTRQGWNAHLNGRGTVVVQINADRKLQPLTLLAEQGISVLDFEVERGRLWN
jgi:nitrous oxidase accessory protein